MTTTLRDLPLNDPAFYASDPFDDYRWLRDEQPLYWCASAGFWTLTRYDDVLSVSKHPETFCNGQGMTMRGGELADVPGNSTLITTDAPRHVMQRRLVNRSFSQRAVALLEPRIRKIAREIVEQARTGETVDFVEEIAARLPVVVIAELLGVPTEDRERFVAWTNAALGVADPEYADAQLAAVGDQAAYFEEALAARRLEPRDDVLSVLVEAEDNGGSDFGHQDALSMCFLLLAAGNETTRNLITHAVRALDLYPEQFELLRGGASLEDAVEEFLRWGCPVIHMARTVTEPTEIHGRELASGDQVVLLYGAANRDDRVFGSSAEELQLDRSPNPHLTFGFGPHFCLGAALARLETRLIFEAMLEQFSGWSVVGPADRLRSTIVLGIKHLPVVLHAA